MSTKGEHLLMQYGPWNAAPLDEPVLIVRAEDWRLVLAMAAVATDKGGRMTAQELLAQAVEMKAYSDENTIPF